MSFSAGAAELTDLAGHVPTLRALIEDDLRARLGSIEAEFDFHRNWNGGWRARVEVTGRGRLEYVLFATASGAVLPLPHPLPTRWKGPPGFAASDGTRWTFDDAGNVTEVTSPT